MQSILASLDHCNQAFLFWTSQLTEQTSQTNQLTQIIKKEPKETTKRKGNILNHNGPEVNLQLNP